jgi:hypothetical protein
MEHTGVTDWFHTYPLPNTASVDVIEEHADGTIFFAGKTKDPNNKNNSIMVVRAKPDGDTLWQRLLSSEYNYTLRDGIITHDGGYLLVGEADTLIPGEIGAWMICVDSDGNKLWKNVYGDSILDTVQRFCSICRFGQEGYAGIGQKNNEIFLLRFNSSGDTLWTKTYNWGGLNFPYKIKISSDNNFVITGYRVNPSTFDSDILVACIDSTGNIIWKKEYGYDTYDELSYNIIQTSDGGYLVAGKTIRISPYRRGAMFYRLDSSGDSIWTLITLSYICYDLLEEKENLYVVAGEFQYEPGEPNACDAWVAKIEERESPIIHTTTPEKYPLKKVSIRGQIMYMDISSSGYLYTLQGRQVLEFSPYSLKQTVTSHFPSGVFIIQYFRNSQPYIRKLVINN